MQLDANTVDNAFIELQQIIAILKKQFGYDFSHYKPNGVLRHIQKHMKELKIYTLVDFISVLHAHIAEDSRDHGRGERSPDVMFRSNTRVLTNTTNALLKYNTY